MTPPKFPFLNEVKALGVFCGGGMIGGAFTSQDPGRVPTHAYHRLPTRMHVVLTVTFCWRLPQ
jgi:hypothetical protein